MDLTPEYSLQSSVFSVNTLVEYKKKKKNLKLSQKTFFGGDSGKVKIQNINIHIGSLIPGPSCLKTVCNKQKA